MLVPTYIGPFFPFETARHDLPVESELRAEGVVFFSLFACMYVRTACNPEEVGSRVGFETIEATSMPCRLPPLPGDKAARSLHGGL